MTHATSRRKFVKRASVGAAALAMSALSYRRVLGANDRIAIGIIGCGDRGLGAHLPGLRAHAEAQNIDIVAACDPWSVRREMAEAKTKEWFGRAAKTFVSYRDLLEKGEVDAVTIASCDHQHTTHLKAAALAKKDAYCEKPLSMDMESLKAACDAVRANRVVVQIGTQLRSLPSMAGARKLYQTGILGTVGRIEQCRNGSQPYWYDRLKDVRKEDVDWREFLMDRPMRPFDPAVYSGWYGYRDFSDGAVPGLGSHYLDLVHYITGATFPTSAVSLGGIYTWKDEYNFTCDDHVHALWTYPEEFLVSYSTNFGNSTGNTFNMFGDQGLLDLVNWNAPVLTADGGSKNKGVIKGKNPVVPVERPDHFLNWIECMRTREDPHASIDAGYQHAVAGLMAMRARDTGQRQVYDRKKREIRAG